MGSPLINLWPPGPPVDPGANLTAAANETSSDEKYLAHEFFTWQGWIEWHRGWTPPEAREAVDQLLKGWPYMAASLARHIARFAYILGALVQRTAPPLRTTWRHEKSRGPQYVIDDLDHEWARQFRPSYEEKLRDLAILGGSVIHVHWVDDVAAGVRRPVLKRWPHEAMWWRSASPSFPGGWYAITSDSGMIRMTPGDGKWIFLAHGERWHEFGALLSLGELFVGGKLSERDEANLSEVAGRAAPIGELPPGFKISDQEGKDFQKMIARLGRAQQGGVMPHKGQVHAFEIDSDTQFFDRYGARLLLKVALAVLGQSATLAPGANGVYQPIVSWSVADALSDKDHEATVRGWDEGLVRPYREVNAIDTDAHLVGEKFADAQAKAKAETERATMLAEWLAAAVAVFDVKQLDVDAMATLLSTPKLAIKPKASTPPAGEGAPLGSAPANIAIKDVNKDEAVDEKALG